MAGRPEVGGFEGLDAGARADAPDFAGARRAGDGVHATACPTITIAPRSAMMIRDVGGP